MVQHWLAFVRVCFRPCSGLVPAHVHWRMQQPGQVALFLISPVDVFVCCLQIIPFAVVVCQQSQCALKQEHLICLM